MCRACQKSTRDRDISNRINDVKELGKYALLELRTEGKKQRILSIKENPVGS